MANCWLRLWHEMPNDPKWRTIAQAAVEPIPTVIAVYIHLLVSASQSRPRGHFTIQHEDIASALGIALQSVTNCCNAMEGRVLEGDYVSGWNARQPAREDDSANRVKQWRERNVTQMQRNVTLDKDKDKEINTNTLAKRKRAPAEEMVDPRYASFVEALKLNWESHGTKLPFAFSAAAGKHLKTFLASNPRMTRDDFEECLVHRSNSKNGVSCTDPIHRVLYDLTRYAPGLFNEFNRLAK